MSTAIAEPAPSVSVVERVILQGDLARLSSEERLRYYLQVCESLGLNPATRPFEYITLNGKLTLYARKDCTEQLRKRDRVSVTITARELVDDVYVVTARATTPDDRTDESIGAVQVAGLEGEAKANAYMKAETKAKRRVTLSICGLGMLDETETDDIPEVRQQRPAQAPPAKAAAAQASLPADGAECYQRLLAKDRQLAEAGLCRPGELVQRVVKVAVQAGHPSEVARWNANGVALAAAEVRRAEGDYRVAAIHRQLDRTRLTWDYVASAMGYPRGTQAHQLTAAQWRETLEHLEKEQPAQ